MPEIFANRFNRFFIRKFEIDYLDFNSVDADFNLLFISTELRTSIIVWAQVWIENKFVGTDITGVSLILTDETALNKSFNDTGNYLNVDVNSYDGISVGQQKGAVPRVDSTLSPEQPLILNTQAATDIYVGLKTEGTGNLLNLTSGKVFIWYQIGQLQFPHI